MQHDFFGSAAGVRIRGCRRGEASRDLATPADLLAGSDPADPFSPYRLHSAGPRHFVDAILAGKSPSPSFLDGVKAQEVIDAAARSNAESRWVDLARPLDRFAADRGPQRAEPELPFCRFHSNGNPSSRSSSPTPPASAIEDRLHDPRREQGEPEYLADIGLADPRLPSPDPSMVAYMPVTSIFRHRNARASAFTIALSTRGRGAHSASSDVTTSFRPAELAERDRDMDGDRVAVGRDRRPDAHAAALRLPAARTALPSSAGARESRRACTTDWSKEFLEAGKRRLAGDTTRQATSPEVKDGAGVYRSCRRASFRKCAKRGWRPAPQPMRPSPSGAASGRRSIRSREAQPRPSLASCR